MTAPTITGLTTSVTFGENTVNAAPQIIDSDVTVTDAEGNFDGGALTVSGHFGGDSVSIRDQGTGAGQIGFSAGTITYGGTAIGTATGGSAGAKLVVTFNANATTAAVEALIENLTYANSNNVNPAASRTLKIVLTDAAGEGNFVVQSGTASPLNGIDVGFDAAPAFGDLDGDGDLDMVVGTYLGQFRYFKNTGTASAPVYAEQTGANNPLNGFDVGNGSVPALVDIDGDGDLDMVSTENDGVVNYFKNTGTASAPVFAEQTGVDSPFGMDPTNFTKAAFADVDGDGDKDMLLGTHTGSLLYYKNTGTATAPVFAQQGGANNPFNGIDTGSYTSPALGDVDGDGDLDLVVGENGGASSYFENTGTTTAPAYVQRTGAANPFNGIDTGFGSATTLVDIDKDGDVDLVVGDGSGTLAVILNATGHVKVNVFTENDAPVAQDASDTTPENAAVVGTFDASDVDGTVTAIVLDSQPAKGSVTIAGNAVDGYTYTYSPDGEFDALDDGDIETVTFTWHAVDNSGASSAMKTVTITVTGVNEAPVAQDRTGVIDESGYIDFDGGASDSDGIIADYVIDSQPAKGTASVTNEDAGETLYFTYQTDGEFDNLDDGDIETVTFTYHAVDNDGAASATQTVTITVHGINDLAQLDGVAGSVTFAEDTVKATPQLIDASVTLTDAEGSFGGGSVTVSGLLAEDIVSINHQGTGAGQIGFANGVVTWGGVAIGTAGGGDGTDFSVTFNHRATTAAVEALVENLTYANVSDAPTASRTLNIVVADASGGVMPNLAARTGADNPFAGIDPGDWNASAFGDIDSDGDLDMVVGDVNGTLHYYENTGSATGPAFTLRTGAADPFAAIDVGGRSSPALVDLDGDGDLDLTVGATYGVISYFENTGTAATPAFTARSGLANPFDGLDISQGTARGETGGGALTFGDLDGDGDLDAIAGAQGDFAYLENVGTVDAPQFTVSPTNLAPLSEYASISGWATPTLGDVDGDGDLDLVIGTLATGVVYFQNTGTESEPAFFATSDSPYAGVVGGSEGASAPGDPILDNNLAMVLVDLDGDGDLDTVVGGSHGGMHYVENTGTGTDITINVTAGNNPPVVEDVSDTTTEDEVDIGYFTFSDPDGDDVTTIVIDSQPAKGSVTVTLDNFYVDHGYKYSPDGAFEALGYGESEEVTFTYHAVDENGAVSETATVTMTVTGVNDAAALSGVATSVTVNENAVPAIIDADVTVTDPEGNFDGGHVTVSGLLAEDTVSLNHQGTGAGQIGYFGDIVTWGGIAIGTATGGAGTDFVVSLNQNATTAAVDALVQTITYANGSESPTASRALTITVADAIQAKTPVLAAHTGADNPFAGIVHGAWNATAFGDLDGDGDLDLVAGGTDGKLYFYENTGSASSPSFSAVTGADSPFNGFDVGAASSPTLADLDGDGDLDLAVGGTSTGLGRISYFENTGSSSDPVYTPRSTLNPFNGIVADGLIPPALGDVDGDGDLDMVTAQPGGSGFAYYENTGSSSSPQFVQRTGEQNPFDGILLNGGITAATLGDFDGDGDLDLAAGHQFEGIAYIANLGTATDPNYVRMSGDANPFAGVVKGAFGPAPAPIYSPDFFPTFVDIDADGYLDVVAGMEDKIILLETTGIGKGSSATVTVNVTGINDVPVASDGAASTGEDAAVSGAVTASDADGTVASHTLVSDVAKGALTFNPDGTWSFDPDGDFDGLGAGDSEAVTFTFKAIDNDGGESAVKTVTITVTGTNDAPVASNGSAGTDENTAVSGTVATSDADGTVVSHALVSGVAKGSLTFLADGSWSFDPDGDFDDLDAGESDTVTFTYRATDNDGAQSDVKTVTITVNGVDAANVAPVAADGSASTSEDSVLDGSVPTATDADGTIAGYALVTDVAKGDLTFNSDGTYSFDPDGAFDALAAGESEEVTFTYRATDNDGANSAVKTITITVNGVDAQNVAPVASNGSASTDEDTAVTGTVTASDADGTVVSHALVSGVGKGSLTFLEDGSWRFDPDGDFDDLDAGESEAVAFTYRATDNDGAQSAVKTVTITVNGITANGGGNSGNSGGGNTAPAITSGVAFTVAENTKAVATFTATDADGDAPVFSIAGGADAFLFTIDAATGALAFKAAPDFEAPGDAGGDNVYEVMVSASDGSATDTETLTITVGNEAGVAIKGSKKNDTVSDGKTVKGQAMPTGEEDTITGKGKNDKLHGAGGNDSIDGGKGNDKLFGDDGRDWLVGGKGNDKLTGGLGEDSFVFNMKLTDNVDTVKDFATGVDTIVLDDKIFKKLSPGPLAVEEFLVGKKAQDGDDHILYNAKNGQLLYDHDGKGGKDALLFAKIGKGLDLDASDFLVI